MPKVSVVVPTYNSAKYLNEAIDSALAQTFKPIEIIVIDDGSTDDTKNIIKRYGSDIVYCYQQNAGSGKARNTGIKLASGEWIAFLDSDDIWHKDHLLKLTHRLHGRDDIDMVYGAQRYVNVSGVPCVKRYEQNDFPEGWIFSELFQANYIATPAVIVRRSLFMELNGFNESEIFRNAQDYDLWLRISANSMILSEPQVAFDYRRHSSNQTLNERRRVKGVLAALNNAVNMIECGKVSPQNHPEEIDIKLRMKDVYKKFVISLFYIGAYDDARKLSFEAIKKKYISIDLLLRAFLCCFPKYALLLITKIKRKLTIEKL